MISLYHCIAITKTNRKSYMINLYDKCIIYAYMKKNIKFEFDLKMKMKIPAAGA